MAATDDHPDEDEILSAENFTTATRAANEGIPVASIGRIIQQPYGIVSASLTHALALGQIGEMPKPDWPPGQAWGARTPSIQRATNNDEIEFSCKNYFGLTPLETSIMMVLLRNDCADKAKLHTVVEHQRLKRNYLPNSTEQTDPKIVDVVICKLRKKLKTKNPEFVLTTSWGQGYYFAPAVKVAILGELQHGNDPQEASGGASQDATA